MFLKRTAAAILGGAMLCTASAFAASLPAPASQPNIAVQPAQDQPAQMQEILPERNLYYGEITEVLRENDQIVGLHMKSEAHGEYVFHMNNQTLLLDSGAGIRMGADALKVGERVYIYHSPAATMSLPPQSYAEAVLTAPPMDMGSAQLHTVEAVQKNPDGSVMITTDRGGLHLTIAKDAQYNDFMGRQMMGADDLRIGTRLFAWYGIVLESYPAQASTAKLTVVPAKAQTELPILVDGLRLETVTAKIENGTLMVPASATAKAFGLTAAYERTAQGEVVTLKNNTTTLKMDIGSDTFTLNDGQVISFGSPAVIQEGTTWMPAEALAALTQTALSIETAQVCFAHAE